MSWQIKLGKQLFPFAFLRRVYLINLSADTLSKVLYAKIFNILGIYQWAIKEYVTAFINISHPIF